MKNIQSESYIVEMGYINANTKAIQSSMRGSFHAGKVFRKEKGLMIFEKGFVNVSSYGFLIVECLVEMETYWINIECDRGRSGNNNKKISSKTFLGIFNLICGINFIRTTTI